MSAPSTVSACIVLSHAGDEVLRAVQCVKDSTLPVELFVADNSPECDTAGRIAALWPEARILPQQENVGFGRGNNAALPHLQSRYHLLVNPDVSFAPDLIERMAAYMDEHPEAVILTPRVFNEDGTEQFLPKKQPTVRYLLGGRLERLGEPFRRWRQEYTLQGQEIAAPTPVQAAHAQPVETNLCATLSARIHRYVLLAVKRVNCDIDPQCRRRHRHFHSSA